MNMTFQVPTIVHGKKVIVVVDFELYDTAIGNPKNPRVHLYDGMTGGLRLEQGELTTGDPHEFQRLGKQMGQELLIKIAQLYIQGVKARGVIQPVPQPTLVTSDTLTEPVVPTQTLDVDVRDFFAASAARIGQAAYSAESIAVATGHSISEVESYLQEQAEQGVLQLEGSRFTLAGMTPPSPWQIPEGMRGQQQLGLEVRLLRIMIGGPGDTSDEVAAARKVLETWNLRNAEEMRTVLLFKHWQFHSFPGLGRPQALINEQVVDKADLLIAVFWARLGMNTGVEESGTVEEIRTMEAAGRPVHLYFSNRPLPVQVMGDEKAVAEYGRVAAYRRDVETNFRGMYATFDSTESFSEQLELHLTARIRTLRDQEFQVNQSPQGSVRAFREKQRGGLATLRQTATQLDIEFSSNLQRVEGGLSKAQQTLTRLAEATTSHYAKWKPFLNDDAQQAWEGLIAKAKQEASMPLTYGRRGSLETNGKNLFATTAHWLDTLENGLQLL